MPCLQSQKEELEAAMGKDGNIGFPVSSIKYDEMGDSGLPELDYMDCITNITKVNEC